MTVPSTTYRNDYLGTGVLVPYPYTFKIFSDSQLLVTKDDGAGTLTTLTLTTDYTVTGAGLAAGGSVIPTVALPSGYKISLQRKVPVTQSTDLRNQGAYFAETEEDALDRLTMIAQQLQDAGDRSIKMPATESGLALTTTLPPAATRALKYVAFDSLGNVIATAGAGSSAVSSAMAPVVAGSTLPIGRLAFGLTRAATIDVRDYLAVGNGTTDDTVAVNAALTAAGSSGRVVFAGGTFKVTTTLTVQAGVELWCEDSATILYTGATRAIKFLGTHKHEQHRIRLDFTGNANTNVDAIDIWQGMSRSSMYAYLKVTTAVRHGVILNGIDQVDGVSANNNQYGNIFDVRGDNLSVPTGVGVYLKGVTGTLNSYANGNSVTGNLDWPTGVSVIGNGNVIDRAIFNSCASAAVDFSGAGTYKNLVTGCYFDASLGGKPIKLSSATLSNNPVFIAVGNLGLDDETGVNNATGSNDVHYVIQSIYSLILQRNSFGTSGAHIYCSDANSDKTLDMRQGLDNADARLSLAGKAYAGGTNKVSDKGGASVSLFEEATNTAEFRINTTTNGSTFHIQGQFKIHPVMGLGYKQTGVTATGGAGGGYVYDGPVTNPPASGTYGFGDIIRNNSPASGAVAYIQCKTGGTPGTWLNCGQLGNRTNAGSPVGSVTPLHDQEMLFDTTGTAWYRSHGTTTATWTKLTN